MAPWNKSGAFRSKWGRAFMHLVTAHGGEALALGAGFAGQFRRVFEKAAAGARSTMNAVITRAAAKPVSSRSSSSLAFPRLPRTTSTSCPDGSLGRESAGGRGPSLHQPKRDAVAPGRDRRTDIAVNIRSRL